jgi:hypothetical protein
MRPDGKARRVRISGIFERGATQPGGMQRRPNAAGLSPRAVRLWVALASVPLSGARHFSAACQHRNPNVRAEACEHPAFLALRVAPSSVASRFQESATSLIAPSGQCQAYLPYGQDGVLVQAINVEEATGLLATRYAPERYQEFTLESAPRISLRPSTIRTRVQPAVCSRRRPARE